MCPNGGFRYYGDHASGVRVAFVPEPVFVNTRKEYPSKIRHMRKILHDDGGFEFTVLPIAELNDGGLCDGDFTVVRPLFER